MRRVTIVGQAPGRRNGAALAFEGPSGRRLAALAGVSERELRRRAKLVNLLPRWPGAAGKGDLFPAAAAKKAAKGMRLGGRVPLAGRGVARAFGVGAAPFLEWFTLGRCEAAVFPHPSGVSHWWNDPANRAEAARFLAAVLG